MVPLWTVFKYIDEEDMKMRGRKMPCTQQKIKSFKKLIISANCAGGETRLLHSQVLFDLSASWRIDNEKPFDSPTQQSSLLLPGTNENALSGIHLCRRGDSNSHIFRYAILSRARLPLRHSGNKLIVTLCSCLV